MKTLYETITLNETEAAVMFAALGNETRLHIFKLLVRAGQSGLSIGVIQDRIGIAASTLSHHIAALCSAGLIHQRREGRAILNTANFAHMTHLIDYLMAECCADEHNQ